MSKQISLSDLSQFTIYFQGNDTVHGQYIPPKVGTNKGEKVKGTFTTEAKKVTQETYKNHLEGKLGLGIVPIDNNSNVRFCVIDVDDYKVNFKMFQDIIDEFELPFVIFKSKSGGMHLYVFFNEDVKAMIAIDLMKQWVTLFGLPETTEIFPKQKRMRQGSKGNWINLPYFGDERRMVIGPDCKEVSLGQALFTIKEKQINFQEFKEIYTSMPVNDGPPCLQSIYVRNDPSLAEMYLFNFAVYWKNKDPNNWQDEIFRINDRLDEPLPEKRIEGQVISAHEKNSYSYKCSEEPICSRCNRLLCGTRKFGKEGDEISSLSYEKLTQVLSDPPHYKWLVNGAEMVFYTEQELRNQDKFSDYCMRFLHVVPNRIKQIRWNAILNKAFMDLKQEEVDLKNDISPGAILADYFYEFIKERAPAKNKSQLHNMGRVWYDKEKDLYYFKKKDFIQFLKKENFRFFQPTEVQTRIQKYGAGPDRLYISKDHNAVRTWSISGEKVEQISEGAGENTAEIDYSKYKQEEY